MPQQCLTKLAVISDQASLPAKPASPPARPRAVLSLFTGAGGLDLGLEAAGFEINGCVEWDADARRTLELNRPEWQIADPGDIHAHDPNALLSSFGLKRGEVAIVSGGPPCQPFSKSALWVAGESPGMRDPRASTLRAYLNVVEAALPDVMLLENVRGITSKSNGNGRTEDAGVDVLRQGLAGINERHGTRYEPNVLHLDAASYGVPQHRERTFVVAAREGTRLSEPPVTHGTKAGLIRYSTTWDAIAECDSVKDVDPSLKLTGHWAELLPSIPEGRNYLWHTHRGGGEPLFGWRTKYWSFLLKLAKARPSWTLQAQPGPATGPFHWRNRRLTVPEMALLQTFPPAYRFEGSFVSARRQVGNAVPAAVGELLGKMVRRAVYGEEVADSLSLIPPLRDDCPPRHPTRKVPAKYLHLSGEHSDHPGPGKGPRAIQRTARAT